MDNAIRRDILARAKATGYPGSIIEAFQAYDQGRDLVQEYVQQQQMPQMQVAETPEEQEQGLGPAHAAGNFNQSMIFPNVQPGQSFNTMETKVPIDIDKVNDQGNLVESYKAVPPGIANLPTGPYEGTVIESPARMKFGGINKYQTAGPATPPANLLWIGDKGQVLSEQEQKIKAERELDNKFGLGPRVGKVDKIVPVVKETEEFEVNEDPLLQIKDPRKTRLTTGKAIDPNKDLMTKAYPTANLRSIISTARARGLSKEDALTLAAMDLQETQWGITDEQTGHVLNGDTTKPPVENFIDAFIKSRETADRLKLKDEYTRLQVYNGLGMITPDTEKNYHGFKMKKIYGVEIPESGINMRNNPLYGKQIVDLRDNVLRKNPEFLSLVDSYYDEKKTGGSYQTNQEISMYEWRTGRPEESRKRYIVGGLKNRVLYNKAKYKR